MTHKAFAHRDDRVRDTFDLLKKEYDAIKRDISNITEMEISQEAKRLPLEELQAQINEIKERMHDYIDTL